MSDEKNYQPASPASPAKLIDRTADNHTLQHESELRSIVEAQRREISLLKERLAALGVDPDLVPTVPESPLPKATVEENEASTNAASNCLPTDNLALETLAEVTGDLSIKLAFPALLRGLTEMDDVRNVKNMCQIILGDGTFGDWHLLFKSFFDEVVAARDSMPPHVVALETSLHEDWHREPWYLLYVQHMGVAEDGGNARSDFDNLRGMLPYIRDHLGFRNICILPHYESPMADGGYDVSAFTTRASLGGEEVFERFMNDAISMGMRVATDAVFNHTSTNHEWFQKALAGEEKYIAYYVQRNGREKIAEWDRDGDIVCRYRDPDGTITERLVVFPDIDRTHGLWVEINGKTYQFYRSFFPFQVDLNLQNPEVLGELFRILARELKQGVVGKRMDAIAHWIKRAGSSGEGLPECHAIQALLKSFIRHINSRAIIMPEVVRDMATAAEYAGITTSINNHKCPSEGDALFSFEMQAALREMTYFQTVVPYWRTIFRSPTLPSGSTWVNLLEHHDETFMGFFARDVRLWLAEYIKSHNGVVYKNGMSAGGRIADCLNYNPERIATALFLLYITPGTPLVYAGTEIGAKSDLKHAEAMIQRSNEKFRKLGVYVDKGSCYDARELQRGPLSRDMFEEAAEQDYEGVNMVRQMNELWGKCGWLREGEAKPLDSGDISVLCMGRATVDGSELVICMVNLADVERWAVVPINQAGLQWGVNNWKQRRKMLHFVDVLTGKKMHVVEEMGSLRFRLEAFGRAVVEAIDDA